MNPSTVHRDSFKLNRAPLRGFHSFLCWLALALAAAGSARAQVDSGINQTIWKMLYGVTDAQMSDSTWPARDDDGDGFSNGAELAAGTNPFDARSHLAVTTLTPGPGGPSLTFPTVAGKLYSLQFTTNLADPASWAPLSPAVQSEGAGVPMTLVAPPSGAPNSFYRVLVQDMDTDGDGVSDWAEIITGFDPATAHTQGAATDDHTALANDLVQENVVTVTATKSTSTQPASSSIPATDKATITITRGGTLHFNAITVPLQWSGSAVVGIDYASLPSSVTFGAKVGSLTLTVVPLANPARQTSATVTVAAMTGGGYSLGGNHIASAVINPAGNANGSGLSGSYYNGTSKTVTPYNPAVLFAGTPALSRVDPTVDYIWSGSPGTGVNATYFGARWQGQVQPQYSETYYFDVNADDGVKLWVNGQLLIDGWAYSSRRPHRAASPSRRESSTISSWNITRRPARRRCTLTGTATASRSRSYPPAGSTRSPPPPRLRPSRARRPPSAL